MNPSTHDGHGSTSDDFHRLGLALTRKAAHLDKDRDRFAVYPGDGSPAFLTDDRTEAADLAHKTNGSWTRVSADTVAADLA